MEKKVKIAKGATMSKAEIDEFDGSLAGFFEEGVRDGSAIVSEGHWEKTVAEIKARNARNERKRAFLRPFWVQGVFSYHLVQKRPLGARSAPFLSVCEYFPVRFPEKKCILCVYGYMRIMRCRAYICFPG